MKLCRIWPPFSVAIISSSNGEFISCGHIPEEWSMVTRDYSKERQVREVIREYISLRKSNVLNTRVYIKSVKKFKVTNNIIPNIQLKAASKNVINIIRSPGTVRQSRLNNQKIRQFNPARLIRCRDNRRNSDEV